VIFDHKHLLSIDDLSKQDISYILEQAHSFKELSSRAIKKVPTLRGQTVITLFFEPSTRTRTSFELAGKRLGADVINVSASSSSVVKGETLFDTAKTLMAMNPDLIIFRHSHSGSPLQLTKCIDASVINAGDGTHEHPTQALLDLMTILEHKPDLEGKKVVMIGDIAHSRVAGSNMRCLVKMGAKVTVVGPSTMIPPQVEKLGVKVAHNSRQEIPSADIIILLRIQLERQGKTLFPSLREYARFFGLGADLLKKVKSDAIIMHPGPINRGVEIAPEVADCPASVILEQVTNGLALRMALLYIYTVGKKGLTEPEIGK